MERFPIGAGISEMRGVIILIRENGGRAYLSQLANRSRLKIDHLLPVIDAARMLGFVRVSGGSISLTESGNEIGYSNFQELIKERLRRVEPFRSVLALLSHKALTTAHLTRALRHKGVALSYNKEIDGELLTRMLTKWGIRTRLLDYDGRKGRWSLVR